MRPRRRRRFIMLFYFTIIVRTFYLTRIQLRCGGDGQTVVNRRWRWAGRRPCKGEVAAEKTESDRMRERESPWPRFRDACAWHSKLDRRTPLHIPWLNSNKVLINLHTLVNRAHGALKRKLKGSGLPRWCDVVGNGRGGWVRRPPLNFRCQIDSVRRTGRLVRFNVNINVVSLR